MKKDIAEKMIKQLEEQREAATKIGIDVDKSIASMRAGVSSVKKDWEKDWEFKFDAVVRDIVNLVVIPDIQSRLNVKIPPSMARGIVYTLFDENLKSFILSLLKQAQAEAVGEIIKEVEKFRDDRISFIVNDKAGGNWEKLSPDEYKVADILTKLVYVLDKKLKKIKEVG